MLKAARSMLTYPASPLRVVEADAVLGVEAAAVKASEALICWQARSHVTDAQASRCQK